MDLMLRCIMGKQRGINKKRGDRMGHSQNQNKETKKWRSMYKRWTYLFRLFKLMSSTAPKDMFFILGITIAIGLISLLSIFSFEQLVNSITSLGDRLSGQFPFEVLLWMSLLIIAILLQSVVNISGGML